MAVESVMRLLRVFEDCITRLLRKYDAIIMDSIRDIIRADKKSKMNMVNNVAARNNMAEKMATGNNVATRNKLVAGNQIVAVVPWLPITLEKRYSGVSSERKAEFPEFTIIASHLRPPRSNGGYKYVVDRTRNTGGGNGRSPIKPADQRHRPARFPYAKIPLPGHSRQGIEPGLPWWEASRLTAQPPWLHIISRFERSPVSLTRKINADICKVDGAVDVMPKVIDGSTARTIPKEVDGTAGTTPEETHGTAVDPISSGMIEDITDTEYDTDCRR
ncbi:hypothetical protein PR048_010994 [Dryococelus australis]|uniref:Uncharacterized protein n=1 Tax=Dryococelus australis TaxID=614101 RepID=A0ABQ9HLL9_9NEOP|nr:hypothetical protein PR048_010994 [Dryococelus australis]